MKPMSALVLDQPSFLTLSVSAHALGGRVRAGELTAPDTLGAQTDAELVTRYLSGDPSAFAALVKRYTGVIYNVTYRFTGDAQEAENLTQETFLRAWHALPRVSLDKPLKAYLIKIAVNLCHDWAEQRKIELVPLDEEPTTQLADPSADPLRSVSAQELISRIRSTLQALPPLYRTVLTLRYSEELSYEEMAAILDLPLNTVRTHLHRAKARLLELIEDER